MEMWLDGQSDFKISIWGIFSNLYFVQAFKQYNCLGYVDSPNCVSVNTGDMKSMNYFLSLCLWLYF